MNEAMVYDMIKRLESVERQNGLLRILVFGMLVALTAAACQVVGDEKAEIFAEVRARKFIMVTGNNEQLAVLDPRGLTLRGAAANIILRNVDEKDSPQSPPIANPLRFQPYISLQGSNGNIRLDAGKSKSKDDAGYGPSLSIDNQPSRYPQLWDTVDLGLSDGNPSLNLYKNRRAIWSAP